MIRIGKKHIGLPPYESQVVEKDLVDMGIKLDDNFILCYDTTHDIVLHTTEELDAVIANLPLDLVTTFYKAYAINNDIHDCIENESVDNLSQALMITLDICAEKYFLTLSDYLEEKLIESYNELRTVGIE